MVDAGIMEPLRRAESIGGKHGSIEKYKGSKRQHGAEQNMT
jgi:hypothetical protein